MVRDMRCWKSGRLGARKRTTKIDACAAVAKEIEIKILSPESVQGEKHKTSCSLSGNDPSAWSKEVADLSISTWQAGKFSEFMRRSIQEKRIYLKHPWFATNP